MFPTVATDVTCLSLTVYRYIINYSPFDAAYKLCKFAPVRLLSRAMDQLHVTHHIHHGVNYALKHYTAAYVIAVLVGVAKGTNLLCFILHYTCSYGFSSVL